jgi:hypothetical protein
MPFDVDRIVAQLTSVISDHTSSRNGYGHLEAHDARRIGTRARAAIQRFAPPDTPYAEDAMQIVEDQDAADSWSAAQLVAIVQALRDDYSEGGLVSVAEIVHADLFDDLLDMATELREKGFLGPAAVLAGSVLEEHLRKLATKVGLPAADGRGRTLSADAIGIELRKRGTITEVQRKSVAAWYAQRSEAAHGRFDALICSEVERMIDGVRDFVARHPA